MRPGVLGASVEAAAARRAFAAAEVGPGGGADWTANEGGGEGEITVGAGGGVGEGRSYGSEKMNISW